MHRTIYQKIIIALICLLSLIIPSFITKISASSELATCNIIIKGKENQKYKEKSLNDVFRDQAAELRQEMVEKLVTEGKLPAVADRLPKTEDIYTEDELEEMVNSSSDMVNELNKNPKLNRNNFTAVCFCFAIPDTGTASSPGKRRHKKTASRKMRFVYRLTRITSWQLRSSGECQLREAYQSSAAWS